MSYLCIVIKQKAAMKAEVGKYFFGRLRGSFGIWQYVPSNLCLDQIGSNFIKGVSTFEEAVKETYLLNGWGEPKNIQRKF